MFVCLFFVFNNVDEDVPAASPGCFVELTVALAGRGGERAQLLAHSNDLVYSLLPSLSKSGFLAGYSEAEVAGLEVRDTAGRLLQHHHTLEHLNMKMFLWSAHRMLPCFTFLRRRNYFCRLTGWKASPKHPYQSKHSR